MDHTNDANLSRLLDAHVRDASGQEAVVTAIEPREDGPQAWVQLADGMRVLVPVQLFAAEGEGGYRLPFRFDSEGGRVVIPVLAEDVRVDKRSIDTGGLRISKHVSEEERVIDEALFRDELDVQRVPVDRMVDGDVPQARQEGDTYIVPVLEEVLVVQKQLLLKEEVRITRRRQEVHAPQRVSVRTEHVSVERFDDKAAPQ